MLTTNSTRPFFQRIVKAVMLIAIGCDSCPRHCSLRSLLSSSVVNSHRSVSPRPTTLLIFLQFYVHDLRFKAWGLTTFFKHCPHPLDFWLISEVPIWVLILIDYFPLLCGSLYKLWGPSNQRPGFDPSDWPLKYGTIKENGIRQNGTAVQPSEILPRYWLKHGWFIK